MGQFLCDRWLGAGALIGLQFVVLTLMSQRAQPTAADAGAAFSTPTIVHFGSVLFLSALLHAPWLSVTPAAVIWGLLGLIGVVYAGIVARRMRSQTIYKPGYQDWLFYFLLPLAAYAMLTGSAFAALPNERPAMFAVGFSALLLLFLGIHNSWDAVTYHVFADGGTKPED